MQDMLLGEYPSGVRPSGEFAATSARRQPPGLCGHVQDAGWQSHPPYSDPDEAGLPGFYISVWHGLWSSKGTPKDVVRRLNAAAVDALADPTVRERLTELGQELPASGQQMPEALGTYQKAEIDKWWPIIRAAGIKVD